MILLSVIMNVLSYYQLDYQGADQLTGKLDFLVPKPTTIVNKTIVPEQFKEDVISLCEYSGISELTPGMTITMSLREALNVMPRKRARLDSYRQLISFLNEEMAITLIINSQKSSSKHEN